MRFGEELEITPLGAAIVEALPDRARVSKIKRDFNRRRVCPTSELFGDKAVRAFYKLRGKAISPVSPGVK